MNLRSAGTTSPARSVLLRRLIFFGWKTVNHFSPLLLKCPLSVWGLPSWTMNDESRFKKAVSRNRGFNPIRSLESAHNLLAITKFQKWFLPLSRPGLQKAWSFNDLLCPLRDVIDMKFYKVRAKNGLGFRCQNSIKPAIKDVDDLFSRYIFR